MEQQCRQGDEAAATGQRVDGTSRERGDEEQSQFQQDQSTGEKGGTLACSHGISRRPRESGRRTLFQMRSSPLVMRAIIGCFQA